MKSAKMCAILALVLALVLINFAQADLIGYWRFDESSGIIAADSAGGDNDGILFGDQLEWTAGRFGGALSHGGVWDAGVEFLTRGMSATAGTVAMWGVLSDPQPAHTKYFFGHTAQPQWNNRVQLYMDEGDNLLDIGLGNSHTLNTDILELPMEQWLHVALTWDSGRYVVYVDGEEVSSGAYGGLSEIYPIANIGNDGSSWPYEGFAGLLDEVRLYDHALNAAEILSAMEGVEQVDITAPGDLVQGVPNDGITYDSGNFGWYSWESPDLVIDDNIETKYLHFKGEIESTGFQVTPKSGPSIVTGLTLTTANDFPARDPIAFELSGSNVGIDGPYEFIASGYIVDFAQEEAWPRLTMNATPISFRNYTAYTHYQLIFTAIRGPVGGSVNSMQIAEVELLGIPAPAAAPGSAHIILVTEGIDSDLDGFRDDHSLESFLISEGHSVDVRPEYWNVLTPDKIAELNAADLIIVSRLAWSSRYNQGNETTEWNSLTTPLLQMNSHFARNIRWKWVNSGARAPDGTSYIYAEAVDPYHPVFRGVLTAHEPTGPDGPLNVVQMIDPLVGTGFTAFIGTTYMGNGLLIAKPVGLDMGWIAEWDVGVEFFEGAGQYAGGRRMLFCAGTFFDPDRQEVITTAQGELNLTAEGLQMFRNAIDYLLGGVEIILVTEEIDWDMDGLRDDHTLESFLVSEGHSVDVRPDYWKVLTPDKIAELNAADLIIFSRLAWSNHYDEGNETTDWNSLTTPLLLMNPYFARNTRWKWVNSWAGTPDDTPYIYAESVDLLHPIFIDMLLSSYAPDGWPDVVQIIDPLVGTGLTSFIGGTDMGNGQLIAKPVGVEMGWIAEWDAGVEFFEGSGQYAGGRRMLFCAGTQEIQYYDYDRQEVITTAQGELNLTAEGLQMFRNAIDYLLEPEFTDDEPNGRI